MHLRQARQRNEREHHILIDRDAQQAVAGGRRELREAAQLVAGQVALIHRDGDRGVAGLLLLVDVGFEPGVVSGVARRGLIHDRQQSAPSPSGCGFDS